MLSELKKRKLTAFFKTFDADGNGYIEKSDIEQIVHNLTAIRNEATGSPTHQFLHKKYMSDWEGLLQATDTNGDGKISLDEWFTFHDQQLQAETPYWKAGEKTSIQFLFELIDLNSDGEIGVEEYALFLKAYHVQASAQEIFAKLDLNGDGHISLHEFVTLCDQFYTSDEAQSQGNWLFGNF
jgi:Ca2+-binding EF-hand superfamily protein